MDGDERRRALPELSEQWVATTDGRQLRAVVAGTGTDLVVLETGLGAAALTWGPVMEHLAPHCRVVAYDRAGYGRSDPGPGPRDLSRLADDLLAVVGAVDHSDRKSTRLNSSHVAISYAVFCLKKNNKRREYQHT